MLTAGLQVNFDDGTTQIDSNHKSTYLAYYVKLSGPFEPLAPRTMFVGQRWAFTINPPPECRYFFFRAPVADVIVGMYIGTDGARRVWISAGYAEIEVYGFADGVPPKLGAYGLQLFDENGLLTFDSTAKAMRISGAFTTPASSAWSGFVTRDWPSSARKYAIGLGLYPQHWMPAQDGTMRWSILHGYAVSCGPTKAGAGVTGLYAIPMGEPIGSAPTPFQTAMIVDVTNYDK